MKQENNLSKQKHGPDSKIYLEELIQAATVLAMSVDRSAVNPSSIQFTIVAMLIRKYITSQQDRYTAYINFCERLVFTKTLIQPAFGEQCTCTDQLRICGIVSQVIPGCSEPGIFAAERQRNRLHKIEITGLAEGVLHLKEDLSVTNLLYWAKWFIKLKATDELNLFYSCVAYFEQTSVDHEKPIRL